MLRAFASLSLSWSLMLAATVLVGAGIAFLNVYMTVVVKTTWPDRIGAMMGLYTGVIGLSGAIGGLTAAPLARLAGGVSGTTSFWGAAGVAAFLLWAAFSRVGDVLRANASSERRTGAAGGAARESILRSL